MTYIEFFDREAVENICTSFVSRADRVIFVGPEKNLMEKSIARYEKIFADREISVKLEYVAVKRDDLDDRVKKISAIIDRRNGEDEEFMFDLTGGDDLCLVAMGIVFERYKDQGIQMHRINLRNNKIADCDGDGNVISENDVPQISIVDCVRAYGGDVVFETPDITGTPVWDMTEDFKNDIRSMWKIFRQIYGGVSIGSWNKQIKVLEALEACGTQDGLTTSVPIDKLKRELGKESEEYAFIKSVVRKIGEFGLANIAEEDGRLVATYKNGQVKRCLTKAGQALEMIVYLFVREAAETDGTPVYNDVLNGVYIDWDGDIHGSDEVVETENEIDVMMMHGAVPVFVSCKNGRVEMEELYKLESVASRFGGRYARKILVATSLGNSVFAAYFRQRAADMKIDLLEPMRMTDAAFKAELAHAWNYITKSEIPVPNDRGGWKAAEKEKNKKENQTAQAEAGKSGRQESDNDPRRVYLQGVACRDGVGAAADPERGVSLITAAAEAGLPEAMKELCAMYRGGAGVSPDLQKALFWAQKCADRSAELYGKEAPETLDALNGLAVLHCASGNSEKAVELLEKSSVQTWNVLGATHPKTLEALNDLAFAYGKSGNLPKELAVYELVYNQQVKAFGEGHPDTLAALTSFAGAAERSGDREKAMQLREKAYRLRVETHGEKHPATVAALSSLADLYEEAGDLPKSAELNENVLALRQEALGENHPDVWRLMDRLAGVYVRTGNGIRALELYEKAYALESAALGEEHPDAVKLLQNLAHCCGESGKGKRALALKEKLYALQCRTLGTAHPDTEATRGELKQAYFRRWKFLKGLRLGRKPCENAAA